MDKHWLFYVALFGILLSACGGGEPTQTFLLPTAVAPINSGEEAQSGDWAVSFSREFPPGFWEEGEHRYGFMYDCPILFGQQQGTDWIFFEVTEESSPLNQPVYLRPNWLSTDVIGGVGVGAIHPDQPTIAMISIVGLSEAAANASMSGCDIIFGYDNGVPVQLTSGSPFRP